MVPLLLWSCAIWKKQIKTKHQIAGDQWHRDKKGQANISPVLPVPCIGSGKPSSACVPPSGCSSGGNEAEGAALFLLFFCISVPESNDGTFGSFLQTTGVQPQPHRLHFPPRAGYKALPSGMDFPASQKLKLQNCYEAMITSSCLGQLKHLCFK